MRIMIVEDSHELSAWLAKLLRADRYIVDCFFSGEDALHAISIQPCDMLIVDLGLPGMSGIDLIKQIRTKGKSEPILILTADDKLESRVSGLDAGADDYLAKPFQVPEFEARVRALLRRSPATMKSTLLLGPLCLDMLSHIYTLDGAALNLSPREHALLECLLRKPGQTVSKEALLNNIYSLDIDVDASVIEVYIHRLRKKLENSTIVITTIRGFGYVLQETKS